MTPKQLYHALVPDRLRYPLGRWRRSLLDRWIRWRAPGPLPPRDLLQSVQMTPWVWEFLDVGRACATVVERELCAGGVDPGAPARILDFGCGLGRTLLHLGHLPWRLHGCDVDEASLEWVRRALPSVALRANGPRPPLPWPDGHFDGLYAISVFTHFDADEQRPWAEELARVLRPGGAAVVTTMGPHALGGFPNLATAANRRRLADDGFLFHRGGDAFNARGAFHTRDHVERLFAPALELRHWLEGGVDGFQDLSLLVEPGPAPAPDAIDTSGSCS